jgi:hypothetical protein
LTGTSENGGNGWGNLFSISPVPTGTATATPTDISQQAGTDRESR